jgi:hypothetical protein
LVALEHGKRVKSSSLAELKVRAGRYSDSNVTYIESTAKALHIAEPMVPAHKNKRTYTLGEHLDGSADDEVIDIVV